MLLPPTTGRNSFTACLELVRGAALVTSFHQHLAITRQVRLKQAYQPGYECWVQSCLPWYEEEVNAGHCFVDVPLPSACPRC